ncbi:MAG: putative Ig domain-containing protein [Pseudomonadota bacterium]
MNKLFHIKALALSLVLTGCGGGAGEGVDTEANDPPVISGASIDYARSGSGYEFTPAAFDPDGDNLTYSIENKPAWAEFDTETGRLRGTPDDAVVGRYEEIKISVSDGTNTVSLLPFSLKVMYGEVGQKNVEIAPTATVTSQPNGYGIVGDAAIAVGNLKTDFKNADLQFEYDANGNLLDLFGDTDLPPVISNTLSVNSSARAVVGMYTGAEINARADIGPDSAPGILLRDEFRYLVYFLNTSVDLVFHGVNGADLPIPLAGSQTLIITDPTDPFFYYFGEIAGISAGYGKSFNGNIPYEPLFDPNSSVAFSQLEPFYGTDVLKGTFPITAYKVFDLLELSGTAICSPPQLLDCDKPSPAGIVISLADALLLQGGIDPSQQFKVGINGNAQVAFRILGIDLFTYQLLDMASKIEVGTDRQHLAIQGVIDPAQSDSPAWLPIKPVPDPGVVMVGNLFADVDSTTGDGDFGISLYGEFPSDFPDAKISGSIDINPQGLQMRGVIPDPDNPITVEATANDVEFTAGIKFGYDFNKSVNTIVDDSVDRALDRVDQVTQDLQDAIGAYDVAFSLNGLRSQIPNIVDTTVDILNGLPQQIDTAVYNAVYDGIRAQSYTYTVPIVGTRITLYARNFVDEASIARTAANRARSTVQGYVNTNKTRLNTLKTAAQETQDGPAFRLALKTALETVIANQEISAAIRETVTINYRYAGVTVFSRTYTVFDDTITYTAFDNSIKNTLQIAANNVEHIDGAQVFMFNTQDIFDALPSKDDLNQVAQDVRSGVIEPPTLKGGGYRVTRAGDQSAYILLNDDRIDITFNPLDPAASITGVGDTIVEYLSR